MPPKPNYAFEKRQREQEKKKKAEKAQRKAAAPESAPVTPADEGEAPPMPVAGGSA
jgi:hypothetical protein